MAKTEKQTDSKAAAIEPDPPVGMDLSPEASARRAGLIYVSDDEPGIERKRWGRGFTYLDPDGNHITDADERARLEALAIPPAYTDVWICPSPKGHLQATGRDDQGRKQYLYHPKWQKVRRTIKFNRLIVFGHALPQIRARGIHELEREGLPRPKVLALVVRLLDHTLIRIGGAQYAAENDSFGLTTLRDRHVDFDADACTFAFTGKSDQKHHITLSDPELARMVRACRDVPGYELFQYYDDEGAHHDVIAEHINAYLKETTGRDITAKQFRTWGGTVHAARFLDTFGPAETEKAANKNIVQMVKEVADRLGNTPAVCREHYIHPAIIDDYGEGTLLPAYRKHLDEEPVAQLEPPEYAVLRFLEDRLKA